ncbi:MAG: hypothetical protein HC896_12700 [Bacteroidales bacterium]|nr:hypothetical protein [Bacteroidales bacterium]
MFAAERTSPLLAGDNNLYTEGSISRGIRFGNYQDVSVNSGLNLQLSGWLTNDIEVNAALADNNIPLQADGYSQQLREFDKVFITLKKDSLELTAGDFELSNASTFLSFYKKQQGAMFKGSFQPKINPKSSYNMVLSGSVARGKYNKLTIAGQEGNQGPYRLLGANNEQYIIVLSGTERVYVNGLLLARGYNNDYVIDYNTAELTFMPKVLITKDSRIVAEFEYADRIYARSLVYTHHAFNARHTRAWLTVYNEQDNKNQFLSHEISTAALETIRQGGDNARDIVVEPRAIEGELPDGAVLYKKMFNVSGIDTVVYYEFSTNTDSARYQLNFAYVGEGNGAYNVEVNIVNGRVYKWAGEGSGAYSLQNKIDAPQKHQVVNAGCQWQPNAYLYSQVEAAVSSRDQNSLSPLDDTDNQGFAASFYTRAMLPLADTSANNVKSSVGYQLVQKHFVPVENIRDIEFERDWNLDQATLADEHLIATSIDYSRHRWLALGYRAQWFNKAAYKGLKHSTRAHVSKESFRADYSASSLQSFDREKETRFYRGQGTVSQSAKFLTAGITHAFEQNTWNNVSSRILLPNSEKFEEYGAFLQNPDSTASAYKILYTLRNDYLPADNRFNSFSTAQTWSFTSAFKQLRNQQLDLSATYRNVAYKLDTNLATDQYLGRVGHRMHAFNRFLNTNITYELGAGKEPQREFAYIRVTDGQGTHKWDATTDYNNNSVAEINEFEVARFNDEANFLKIYLPGNQYTNVKNNLFKHSGKYPL